mmetsp:Transcript_53227/g.84987  ORF Transcript_53227/g.84987 Transcript_53227/m.84987 type:complete len:81 (-) Transcript_53227:210-452(-)
MIHHSHINSALEQTKTPRIQSGNKQTSEKYIGTNKRGSEEKYVCCVLKIKKAYIYTKERKNHHKRKQNEKRNQITEQHIH